MPAPERGGRPGEGRRGTRNSALLLPRPLSPIYRPGTISSFPTSFLLYFLCDFLISTNYLCNLSPPTSADCFLDYSGCLRTHSIPQSRPLPVPATAPAPPQQLPQTLHGPSLSDSDPGLSSPQLLCNKLMLIRAL